MGIRNKYKPTSASTHDTWEDWMDGVELTWNQRMEAARLEYEGIRDAVQAKRSNEGDSAPESTSAHLRSEDSAE